MCGIHASLSTESFRFPSHNLKKLLHNRGPDHGGEEEVKIENQRGPYYLSFTSTVLSLRGGHVTIQPFVDFKTGSILCWNGEAWKIGADVITGNDGQAVFNALLEVIPGHSTLESTTAVLNLLNSISGPFAFVFLDRIHKQIFFGRDRLGRRSLLCCTTSNSIEFSSAADPLDGVWKEVEADAVYSLPLDLSATAGAQNSAATHMLSILPFQRYAWAANENFLVSQIVSPFHDSDMACRKPH
jgi:asparagine synthetase B (glutamine-hydrolysing)